MVDVSSLQLYERLGVTPDELEAFCVRSHIAELAFFGSVLRDDFKNDSDIDVLVSLLPSYRVSFFGFFDIEEQLEQLFQRSVDLLDRETVEIDSNWIRRQDILENAQVAYESRRVLSAL